LFEVTRDPLSHPELHEFLKDVGGFDTVGDESALERSMDASMPRPAQWNTKEQPPYAYWLYYLNANIQSLNQFRRMRDLNVFDFRPHCGESGDVFHLAAGFLTAKSISHGTQLGIHPVLQYLYYAVQIGIAAAPLSESTVHLRYENDPFPTFVKRGLNVSLSTDNPLQLHATTEPLIEEYANAAQMWKLSQSDLCEIARNSVLQSSFTYEEKEQWIGPKFWRQEVEFNDIRRTNVPNVRLRFRRETYLDEMGFLRQMQRSQSEMSSLLCLM
jgi:AMP deaminase